MLLCFSSKLNGLENEGAPLMIIQPHLDLVIFCLSHYYSLTDIISQRIFSLLFCIPESLVCFSSESKVLTLINVLCLFIALGPDGQVTLSLTWRCLDVLYQLMDAKNLHAFTDGSEHSCSEHLFSIHFLFKYTQG